MLKDLTVFKKNFFKKKIPARISPKPITFPLSVVTTPSQPYYTPFLLAGNVWLWQA